jgi:4-amino-4-deoxy-L-arabinose transferase-like glycosyltransferase
VTTSTTSSPGTGRQRVWALGLFAGALVWRLTHLVTARNAPFFDNLYIDPKMYDAWAARIAGGELLSEAPFFLDPLYPYFVGGIYALFGRSPFAVAGVQSALDALIPPLVLLAAWPWFRRPVPQIAGVVAIFYPVSVYYGLLLLKPALATLLVATALWCFSRALSSKVWAWWGLAGVATGLSVLTRGSLLLVVPVIVGWALLDPAVGDRLATRLRCAALCGGGVLLVLLLPTAHNRITGGEWILTTTNWGQIFYIGNNEANPSGRFLELPYVRSDPTYEQVDFKGEAERRNERTMRHGEVSRYWFGEGLAWAAAHPGDWAKLMWSKLRIYWGAYETPASHDFYFYRRHAPLLRLPLPAFGLLGPLALLGAVLAWPRGGWPRLLVLYTAATTLAVVIFFVLTRFRMVLMPALFPLAALGAVELVARTRAALRGERRTATAGWAALFLVFVAFVNLPVRATADTWRYRVAAALRLPVRLETTAGAHFNLGVTYAARASESKQAAALLELAESELREAVREEPLARHWVELGKVLARQQRNDDAITAYRAAAELEPADYRIHHALGLLHRRAGRADEAAAAFREALRRAPRHAASAVQLGELMLQQQRDTEAAELFRYALRLRPGDARARAGLAAAESR